MCARPTFQAHKGRKAIPEPLARKVRRAIPGLRAPQARKGHKDLKAILALLEQEERQVLPARLARLGQS